MKIVDGIKAKESTLAEAVAVLRSGGLVIYPTETTYGIAIDVENPVAVQKLLDYKGKRDGKAISVAVTNQDMAERYVNLNDTALKVYKTFLPGPVTVISTGTGATAPGVAAQDGKVGIRIPNHPLTLELIEAFGHGISATGANASNKKRPYTIQDILDNTTQAQQKLVDLIIDFGELPHNEPSTVIDTTVDDIKVLRQGPTNFKDTEIYTSSSEEETLKWFEQFVRRFRSYYTYTPVLFLFSGEMGAGKTHAIAGMAKGLGITESISSPTYAIANEFDFQNESIPGTFVHIDCWKLSHFEELVDIGLDAAIEEKSVVAIEWADRFQSNFEAYADKAKVIWIHITSTAIENERIITYFL